MWETVPSPKADPAVNQTAHGMLSCDWQVMQMHISERQAGATQHCWQNNADGERKVGAGGGRPHNTFNKQDRDMDHNEQRST